VNKSLGECASGGSCAVGDIGPGGGTVFYIDKSTESEVKYFEVACQGWDGEDNLCGGGYETSKSWDFSRKIAAGYLGGGKTDWRLPSKEELNELCKYARLTNKAPGGETDCSAGESGSELRSDFATGGYWSSTEGENPNVAWVQNFGDGEQSQESKREYAYAVRPVRSFLKGGGVVTSPSTTLLKTCAQGGVCKIGDTGPGGGTVFYDAGQMEQWGRYLEFACSGWRNECDRLSPDPELEFGCTNDQFTDLSEAIGSGKSNTQQIIDTCGEDGAAGLAQAYVSWSPQVDDWFLPSLFELEAMQEYLKGGFSKDFGAQEYWTSTTEIYRGAVYLFLSTGTRYVTQGTPMRVNPNILIYASNRVRPIRAF